MEEDPSTSQGSSYTSGNQDSNRDPQVKNPLDNIGIVDDAQDGILNNPSDTQGSRDPSGPPFKDKNPIDNNQIIKDDEDPFLDNNRNNSSIE